MGCELSLLKCQLLNLVIIGNENLRPDLPIEGECKIGIDFNILKAKGETLFKIVLKISMEANGENVNTGVRKLELEVEGVFQVSDNLDEQKLFNLLHFNGLTILYGVVRGIVMNVTGSFPGGRIILPCVNMAEIIERHYKKKKPSKSKKKKITE